MKKYFPEWLNGMKRKNLKKFPHNGSLWPRVTEYFGAVFMCSITRWSYAVWNRTSTLIRELKHLEGDHWNCFVGNLYFLCFSSLKLNCCLMESSSSFLWFLNVHRPVVFHHCAVLFQTMRSVWWRKCSTTLSTVSPTRTRSSLRWAALPRPLKKVFIFICSLFVPCPFMLSFAFDVECWNFKFKSQNVIFNIKDDIFWRKRKCQENVCSKRYKFH